MSNCHICSKILVHKQKKFCSTKCFSLNQQRRITLSCHFCGENYRVCLSAAKSKKGSKYCGEPCRRKAVAHSLTKNKTVRCEVCHKDFKCKPSHKRRFCGMKCYRVYQSSPLWVKELGPSGIGQFNTFKKTKPPCLRCKNTKNIQIHHGDGNRSNNELCNLFPLCKDCHSFLHSLFSSSSTLLDFTLSFIKN